MKDFRKMNKNNNKQDLVNSNMEQLFNLPPGSTAQDKSNKVLRSNKKDKETEPMVDNQNLQTKKKGRGGARPNSGRKVGSTVKLSAADLLAEIARQDKPFAEGLAEDYKRARLEGDLMIVQRYQQMFLSKVLADKQEVDMTSNGQTIGASFTFPSSELPDWTDEQPIKH
jgi:hypothetical protein